VLDNNLFHKLTIRLLKKVISSITTTSLFQYDKFMINKISFSGSLSGVVLSLVASTVVIALRCCHWVTVKSVHSVCHTSETSQHEKLVAIGSAGVVWAFVTVTMADP